MLSRRPARGPISALWLLSLLGACGAPAPVTLVRGGAIGAGLEGRALGGDQVLVPLSWRPGERVEVGGQALIGPPRPECVPIFQRDLGDVARHVARGGTAPDAALALSPDGALLAVGTFRGEVLLLDAWTGALRASIKLDEALVKELAFSPDGAALYVGEQSPEARLYALDGRSLERRWALPLADRVGRSPAPAGDDLYGVYTLPAVMGLEVLGDGALLVAAAHGWVEGGERRNLSQLLVVSPGGEPIAAWPEHPADVTLWHPAVDEAGGLVAVPVGRSAAGEPPAELPVGGVQLLSLPGLTPQEAVRFAPLRPWFDQAFVWEALDASRAAGVLYAGLGDGRVILHPLGGGEDLVLGLGTPVVQGEVPLAATVGQGRLYREQALSLTSGTSIPFGAAAPSLRPPSLHPAENTLWAHDLAGALRWTWRGPYEVAGLAVAGDTLALGAGPRRTDAREDLFGVLLFDLAGEGTGAERLITSCPTEGPVFFRMRLAEDGRVFAVEHPWVREDGSLGGSYRLTALR
ncbi:MAG: hypothetical protein JXX28_01330 [Deltaproteobacteria bacterium]|nr:hypothetical protein [Deltaproteobacteria bacterium]